MSSTHVELRQLALVPGFTVESMITIAEMEGHRSRGKVSNNHKQEQEQQHSTLFRASHVYHPFIAGTWYWSAVRVMTGMSHTLGQKTHEPPMVPLVTKMTHHSRDNVERS